MTINIMGDINIQHRTEPERAFDALKPLLARGDINYANMEGCFYHAGSQDIPEKKKWVHSETSQFRAIPAAGFNALGGANNVNYGAAAIENTLALLKDSAIPVTGLGRDEEEAWTPLIIEVDDQRIGFIQVTSRYYGRESWAGPDRPGVAAFDPDDAPTADRVIDFIGETKKRCDLLIFSHHLRYTGTSVQEEYQKPFVFRAIDAGADLVFGHGAHVYQEIEFYKGVPVFHCLAQTVFDWTKNDKKREGIVLTLAVEEGRIGGLEFRLTYHDDNHEVILPGPDSEEFAMLRDSLVSLSPGVRFREENGVFSVSPLSSRRRGTTSPVSS